MAKANGLTCEVLDQDRMRQLGMGALLGVAQGSAEPGAMVIIEYKPAKPTSDARLALIGKGVTFDTGGISIKPAEGMEKMKYDMCGAAAVIGAMQAIARLKPSIAVTGIVPTVENMPGGKAQRPGDIVTSLSGKTIEILNTDAEGRLILADAITYAKQLGCTHLVDAATLTGAIVVALGNNQSGVFTNNDELLGQWMSCREGFRRKDVAYAGGRLIPRTAENRIRGYRQRGRPRQAGLHPRPGVPEGIRGRHPVDPRGYCGNRLAGRCQAVHGERPDRHTDRDFCKTCPELEVSRKFSLTHLPIEALADKMASPCN